jgi:hypothetical protein
VLATLGGGKCHEGNQRADRYQWSALGLLPDRLDAASQGRYGMGFS